MTTPFETTPILSSLYTIRHGFFGREGGVSPGIYNSLNASETGGDNLDLVSENRARIATAMGVEPHALATLSQVHSATVITLLEEPAPHARPQGDAMVTNLPGIAIGILTADCTPILFADPESGVIGAAHAGWKGAVGKIVPKTIDAMVALGAERSRIIASIGPTISGPNYEVGTQFMADVLSYYPEAKPWFFVPEGKREHFDLPGLVEAQLQAAGIGAVENLGACTYASPALYFSHRYATHQDRTTGRQMAVIART
jgi:YfiH family protein